MLTMAHEITRGGIITARGHAHPCLCRRRDEGPAWIADAVRHHALREDPVIATILATTYQPDSCRLTVRDGVRHEPLAADPDIPPAALAHLEPDTPTRLAVAFSTGSIWTAETTADAARAQLANLLRQRMLMTAAASTPPRPVLIALIAKAQPPWVGIEPSIPTTRLQDGSE